MWRTEHNSKFTLILCGVRIKVRNHVERYNLFAETLILTLERSKKWINSLLIVRLLLRFLIMEIFFSTIDDKDAKDNVIPEWALVPEGEKVQGFYPDWLKPQKIGIVSNLYIRPEYHGTGLGKSLFKMAMEWMESNDDINLIYIYVSNGNESALSFYLKQGFTFSHDVFGGFIHAV